MDLIKNTKVNIKAIFDSQDYERNALQNLRRWLTTPFRVAIAFNK